MTDLEVQCGGSGKGKEDWIVDGFLGWWWVMSGPHNALSRQNAAGADNLDAIIIWNIWELRKDNHKICSLSLRFGLSCTSDNIPPACWRVQAASLPQYCSGILWCCCWSSLLPNIRWQKTGAVSGDWATGNTEHTNRAGDGSDFIISKVLTKS